MEHINIDKLDQLVMPYKQCLNVINSSIANSQISKAYANDINNEYEVFMWMMP